MHCVIAQPDLAHALKVVSRAVGNAKSGHAILSHVLLQAHAESLTVTAYDLDLGIRLEVPAVVSTEGDVCVPHRLLADIIATQDDEHAVTLQLDGERLAISTLGGSYGLAVAAAEDFPALPTVDAASSAPVALGGALTAVLPCCSSDASKALLGGVHMAADGQALTLEATDGHRLAVRHQPADGLTLDLVLPARTLATVARLDNPLQLAVDRHQCAIRSADGTELISRLLDGTFPKVQSLIPETFKHQATCSRHDLLRALERIAVIARATNNIIKTSTAGGVMSLAAEADSSTGKASVAIDGTLPPFAANIDYLIDGLRNMIGATVTICANNKTTPIVFKIEEQVYLVMPVQVRDNA